jgi:uncharacterized membrane protein YeaQ/YmgE (transglycosylase-associated protein family)
MANWNSSLARTTVQFSSENLVVIVAIGVVAGWLVRKVARGVELGLIGDLGGGVIGAFFGGWLPSQLDIQSRPGTMALIINSAIGAILVLIIIRLAAGSASGGSGGWASRNAKKRRSSRPW